MDITDYISSGILELYIAGKLSEKENQEIHDMMSSYPKIKSEVEEIEAAIIKLTASLSNKELSFLDLNHKLSKDDTPVVPLFRNTKWISYTGWAASILLASGMFWIYQNNQGIQNELDIVNRENSILESEIQNTKDDLSSTTEVLDALRYQNIISIPLGGQGDFQDSYAKVYWNKEDNTIYLDGKGLPDAPSGKVWQVWSLTLNPLTPTSLGTIDDFNDDKDKVFVIENSNESQAFGITLEPAGGSESPTLEQLYTLGVVDS